MLNFKKAINRKLRVHQCLNGRRSWETFITNWYWSCPHDDRPSHVVRPIEVKIEIPLGKTAEIYARDIFELLEALSSYVRLWKDRDWIPQGALTLTTIDGGRTVIEGRIYGPYSTSTSPEAISR